MSYESGSEMSGSESDIEIKSALPALTKKTAQKTPKSPLNDLLKNQNPKKMTTKDMIKEALTENKSRKGISLHAIRKFIVEKHTVNVDRITTQIKKSLKSGIEEGSIVQTKGIGATGSFKLAKKQTETDKPKKKPKPKTEKTEKAKTLKKQVDKKEKAEEKVPKNKVEAKTSKIAKKDKTEKKEKPVKTVEVKEKKVKAKAKMAKTPAKKRAAMMKRHSIGSIIKPPKMKPKAPT